MKVIDALPQVDSLGTGLETLGESLIVPAVNPDAALLSQPVRVGPNVVVGNGEFAVIAGPCAIESESQFNETSRAVRDLGAVLLRGGIWKIRTSHRTFQGLGGDAFQLVRNIIQETGMGFVTEVTDARQIEEVDEFVSMYQVGARNMYNYALLKELGKTKKPVLLKRAFSALVDEWIKAGDYVTSGGNSNVILCERGIRTFETSSRFTLDLNSILVAKSRSNYPVIVDPSHAVGIAEYVPKLALAAAAVGADGIIVEVHPRPIEALSDGKQALTVEIFATMMKQLELVLNALGRKMAKLDNTGNC